MMCNKRMTAKKQSDEKIRSKKSAATLFGAVAFVMLFIFSGCKDDESTGLQTQEVVDIIISPDSVEFSEGEQMQFSAFVLTDAGDTVAIEDLDVEWEGKWWSSDPEVFSVEENGLATGQNPGEAHCVIELTLEDNQIVANAGFITKSRGIFVGRDSAFVVLLN